MPAVFQRILKVTNSTELEVVDGGFLLTEEQLNTVNSELAQNETVIKTLTEKVNILEESQADPAQLETIQKELTEANAKVNELTNQNTDQAKQIKELEEKVAKLEEDPAGSFLGAMATGIGDAAEEAKKKAATQKSVDQLEHNQMADKLTGKKKK